MADSSTEANTPDAYNPMEDIEDLVCVLQNVLSLSQKGKKVVRRFADLVYVENYQKMLEGCKPEDFRMHSISFSKFYVKYQTEILNSLDDDTWISTKDCRIWLGDHDAKLRRLNIILPISNIYDKAEELKAKQEKEKESRRFTRMAEELSSNQSEITHEGSDDEGEIELLTDKILYYTLCIFRNCLDLGEVIFNDINLLASIDIEEDLKILEEIIEIIGKGIGIDGREVKNTGPLSGLVDGITGFLRGSNITGPDGKPIGDQLQGIDSKAISDAMSGFFNNKDLTDKISSRISTMNNAAAIDKPEDMTTVLSDMFKEVGPQLAGAVVGMMDTKPPPGVTDTRTPQQKQEEKEKMEKSISSMMSTAGDIAKSIDAKALIPTDVLNPSESSSSPSSSSGAQ